MQFSRSYKFAKGELCKNRFAILVILAITVKMIANGDNEIRTHDPLLARQVLSQLSYTPVFTGLKWTRTTDLTLIRRAL